MRLEATKWRYTFGLYALFVCLGLSTAIVGPTIPDLARQTGSSLGRMGLLFLGGSIGYTLGTLLGGRLFDRLRGHTLLGAAELAIACCLAAFAAVPWFWLLLAVAFIRGLAEGLVNTGANTLLLWTHGEGASPFMNGLNFCFGVGAFVAPLVVARFASSPGGFRRAYWAVAGFAALSGLWLLAMRGSPGPGEHARRATAARAGSGRVRWAPVAAAALFLFAYVGGEISFGSWVFTYAVTLGVASAAGAAYLTSAFWLSFTLGRLVSIPAAIRFTPRQVIPVALAACLAISGLLMVLPQSSGLLWASAIGLGFCMGPLWPSGFTLASQVIPMTALASSLVLLGDSFGGMVLPSLSGRLIERAGSRPSLTLPLLVFGSMLTCLLAHGSLLVLARRLKDRAPGPPAVSSSR